MQIYTQIISLPTTTFVRYVLRHHKLKETYLKRSMKSTACWKHGINMSIKSSQLSPLPTEHRCRPERLGRKRHDFIRRVRHSRAEPRGSVNAAGRAYLYYIVCNYTYILPISDSFCFITKTILGLLGFQEILKILTSYYILLTPNKKWKSWPSESYQHCRSCIISFRWRVLDHFSHQSEFATQV